MEEEKDEGKAADDSTERDAPGAGGACESDSPEAGEEGGEARIRPVREKIGEGEGNLRRRGGWFRRRTGG